MLRSRNWRSNMACSTYVSTRLRLGAVAIASALAIAAHAADSGYPNKPVRVIVPFTAAGSTDILARALAQRLSEQLGQSIIIDNRGGAGGVIGADLVAKAPPDGYTMLITTAGVIVTTPSLHKKLPYDSMQDFAPVGIIASLPNMLVVHPSLPVASVNDLVKLAKARPGQLSYSSGGVGTSLHLAGALLSYLAGVDIVHVAYKGGGPAVLAGVSGEVAFLFATMSSAIAQAQAGKLRAIAVTSSKRSPATPELPTMVEAGIKGFEMANWIGALVPRGTPVAIVERLNRDISRSVEAADVKTVLRSSGYEIVASTPAEMAASIRTEIPMWAKVIKAAKIQAN
jgi:tripartite-type tricarboxylate transporter receptor subunit TctC